MLLHHYNPQNGAFVFSREARIDHAETQVQGQRVYLSPAHTTDIPPPAVAPGFAAIWTGAAWETVPDLRGRRYWTAAAGLATQEDLGALAPGATLIDGDDPALVLEDGLWRLETAHDTRNALSAQITAEQERRRYAAMMAIPGFGTQQLDERTVSYLNEFNRLWMEGRVNNVYTFQADQGALSLTAGQVRVLALAAERYQAALPAHSATLHATLAGLEDSALHALDYQNDIHWPATNIAVDFSAAPAKPATALETRLLDLEARVAILEAAP